MNPLDSAPTSDDLMSMKSLTALAAANAAAAASNAARLVSLLQTLGAKIDVVMESASAASTQASSPLATTPAAASTSATIPVVPVEGCDTTPESCVDATATPLAHVRCSTKCLNHDVMGISANTQAPLEVCPVADLPVTMGADTMCPAVPDAPETFQVGSVKPDVVFEVDTPHAINIQEQHKLMLTISDLSIRVPPRPPDWILEYMLKLIEVCNACGFVYGIIPEKGKPVSGASDNIRAGWKEKVRFNKNGPAAIAKYEAEHLGAANAQSSVVKNEHSLMDLQNATLGSLLLKAGTKEPPKRKRARCNFIAVEQEVQRSDDALENSGKLILDMNPPYWIEPAENHDAAVTTSPSATTANPNESHGVPEVFELWPPPMQCVCSTIFSEFWCISPFWTLPWLSPVHNPFNSGFTKQVQVFLWSVPLHVISDVTLEQLLASIQRWELKHGGCCTPFTARVEDLQLPPIGVTVILPPPAKPPDSVAILFHVGSYWVFWDDGAALPYSTIYASTFDSKQGPWFRLLFMKLSPAQITIFFLEDCISSAGTCTTEKQCGASDRWDCGVVLNISVLFHFARSSAVELDANVMVCNCSPLSEETERPVMDGPRRLLALAVLLASAYGADAAGLFRAPPTGYKYNATFTFTGEFLVLLSCMGPANGTAAYGHGGPSTGGIIHNCTLDQLKEGSYAPETTPFKFNHGHGYPAPSPRAAPPEDGLLQAAAGGAGPREHAVVQPQPQRRLPPHPQGGGEQEQHAGAAPAVARPLRRRRRRLRHCLQRWPFANGRTTPARTLDAVNHGHGHPPPSPPRHAAPPENGLLQAAAGGGGAGPREHAVAQPQPQRRLPPHPHGGGGGGGGGEQEQYAGAAPAVAPRRRRLRHCLQRWSCANGRTTPARSLDAVSDGGKKEGEEDEN